MPSPYLASLVLIAMFRCPGALAADVVANGTGVNSEPIQLIARHLTTKRYDPEFSRHYDDDSVKSYLRSIEDQVPAGVQMAARRISIRMSAVDRNEIYARHGYVFKTSPWKEIFTAVSWYHPNPNFRESEITPDEKFLLAGLVEIMLIDGDAAGVACLKEEPQACGGAPKSDEYRPKVLIEAAWGDAPGKYGLNYQEEDPTQMSFALTDNEEIFVTDVANDRVQHYDRDGNLLEAIPVRLSEPATEEQKKKQPLLEQSKWLNGIEFVRGDLYIAMSDGNRRDKSGYPASILLKFRNHRLEAISTPDQKSGTLQGLVAEVEHRWLTTKIPGLLGRDRLFHKSGGTMIYDGAEIFYAFIDNDGNRWVQTKRTMRKYSPSGFLLYETTEWGTPTMDGNFFVLNTYSRESCDEKASNGECGVQIIKYSRSTAP